MIEVGKFSALQGGSFPGHMHANLIATMRILEYPSPQNYVSTSNNL
jgi:hypothetical protein